MKKSILSILVPIFYLMCSVGAWGISTGEFCCYHPEMNSKYMAGSLAVVGPLGLVISSLEQGLENSSEGRGFHFRMRPLTYEQRWNAFHRKYSSLSRYYFDHGHEEGEGCRCDEDK